MAQAQPKKQQRVEDIADRIGDARRRLGVTRKEDITPADLARLAGLPNSTVTRIENREVEDPNDSTLGKLADVLGVTKAWLRYGTPSTEAGLQIPIKGPDRDA